MNPLPREWCKSSDWIEAHVDCIERVYVALVRECEQVNVLCDNEFSLEIPIEKLAIFLQKCAPQDDQLVLSEIPQTIPREPLWSSKFNVPTSKTSKVKCKLELRSCLHSPVKLNVSLHSRT